MIVLRRGADAWNAWREANPSIRTDLREANLNGANLQGTFLRGVDLGMANLNRANLSRAILTGSNLSEADLSGANLSRADLGKAALNGANVSRANFSEANLNAADLAGSNLSLANLSGAELTGVRWQLRAMRGCYLGIRGLDSCFGNALFKRAAADQDFLDTLEAHLKGTRRMALFRAWGLIDYGRSLLRVATISFGLAAIYGAIYRIFPSILDYSESANSWFTPYYFSIVTYTTLGFGDVRPANVVGEMIVSSEVILGYTTLGLLLSVLAQSIARRS